MPNAGAFKKGEKKQNQGKRGPSKTTVEFRETVTRLLESNAENMGRWLTLVAEGDGTDNPYGKPDPAKALDLLAKLAEFAAPKLARTEHTGENGGAIKYQQVRRTVVDPAR